MDYNTLFSTTLKNLGFDPVIVPNTFNVGYCPDSGWPLKTPNIDFRSNTVLVLHFQDFVEVHGNAIRELDHLEKIYKQNMSKLLVTFWNHGLDKIYTGPIKLIEFSNHNYDFANVLRQRQQEWDSNSIKNLKWQCLNGRVCDHRRQAVAVLKNWSHGVVSLGSKLPLPLWDYTSYRGCENDDNFIRLQYVYQQCAVNIVTETIYDTTPGIISEKTLMAFAAKQVPLLIGHRGIVNDCRELGFDMFDDVIDNSFDQLPNNIRLETALELNKNKILQGIDLSLLDHRLEHNKNYLLNQFPTWMQQRFRSDCLRVLQRYNPLV